MSKRSLSNLNQLSKEELISIIMGKTDTFKKSKGSGRSFDPLAYPSQHIALKVAYFGSRYQGFASQNGLAKVASGQTGLSSADTVEDYIFKALLKTKLILDPSACNYSRCGRTDAGVSSTGQVIALRLRSGERLSGQASQKPLDYCSILNKQLPDDIRVINWAVVEDSFSARFSCSGRLYHYYFFQNHYDSITRSVVNLDIEKMRQSAKHLEGVHDFRNFCKRDPSKPNQTFVREIFLADFEPVPNVTGFYRFICKGSAFLYHQIRCIMSTLFMIGAGQEPVDLVPELLKRINCSGGQAPGPLVHYEIASEIPLVLFDCFFEKNADGKINWIRPMKSCSLTSHFHRLWEAKQSEALIIKGILSTGSELDESLDFSEYKRRDNLYDKVTKI